MKMQPLPQAEHYVSWTCWVLCWWLKNYWFFKPILVQHSAKGCQSHRIQVQLSYQINCIEINSQKNDLDLSISGRFRHGNRLGQLRDLEKIIVHIDRTVQDVTCSEVHIYSYFLWNLWHASVIFSWHLFSGDNILVTSWSFFLNWTGVMHVGFQQVYEQNAPQSLESRLERSKISVLVLILYLKATCFFFQTSGVYGL